MTKKPKDKHNVHHVHHHFPDSVNVVIYLFVAVIIVGGVKMLDISPGLVGQASQAVAPLGEATFSVTGTTPGELCFSRNCETVSAQITVKQDNNVITTTTISDSTTIENLPSGNLVAEITANGYYSENIQFSAGDDVNVRLTKSR
ncbi:MAG: hypothetical protein QF632_01155 [Candidatus Woesearchaeota archaeon]|nr:hypothetical protein [Candidatus Woesearchaeota archaeon]MDP7458324.1 hypothetical protein [Candidatus Woesearchaeota archaeon]